MYATTLLLTLCMAAPTTNGGRSDVGSRMSDVRCRIADLGSRRSDRNTTRVDSPNDPTSAIPLPPSPPFNPNSKIQIPKSPLDPSQFSILNSPFASFAIRHSPFAIASPSSRPASLRDDPRAQRWRDTLFWSLILFLILIVASIAIIRFSRRYLAYLRGAKPAAPTTYQDVWSMHKLPPGALDSPPDASSGPAAPSDPDAPANPDANDDSDDDAPPPEPDSRPPNPA